MIEHANLIAAIAIVAVLMLAALFLTSDKGDPGYSGFVDHAAYALIAVFVVAVEASQLLILFGLHVEPVAAWRMVALYFTAILCFFSMVFLAMDFAGDMTSWRRLCFLPPRWISAMMWIFGVSWVLQLALLLTR